MPQASVRPDLLYGWRGTSLLIVNTHGECADDQALSGFYHREARFLRACALTVNGERPWRCEAAAVAPERLDFTYTYPEVTKYGGGGSGQSGDDEPRNDRGLPQRALNIHVVFELTFGGLRIHTGIDNRAREAVDVDLKWTFAADFADIQEAQSFERKQTATVRRDSEPGILRFHYDHEQLPYSTLIDLPAGWEAVEDGAAIHLHLEPSQRIDASFEVRASTGAEEIDGAAREAVFDAWRRGFTETSSSHTLFESLLNGNVRDFASFALMDGERDEWLTLQAGVPLYPALFGRDAITAGWQAGYVDRGASLEAALTRLGRMQSARDNEWRDEEPGRIPYQVRSGPLAVLDLNPYARYYADFASPLMFVIAVANHYAWTGDKNAVDRHWDAARRILDWARERGDRDGDGYLEYLTRSKDGTKNQGWKDSGDAVIYDDGSPVPAPIATCELQGYWYSAQQLMGALCWMRGDKDDARAHFDAAADLKRRFNADWWVESESCPALALDPDKRQVTAVTSNAGHCLATGIIDKAHVPALVGRLFAPDMFSGWGIRTLSTEHQHYNPLSYHRGTVWPVEQGTIVFGLRRYGFDARAQDLSRAMVDLATLYPEFRIPECVGGEARGDRPTPGAYPQANTPQLWNATAFPLIVQSLLGLLPIAPYEVLVVDPALPDWLPDLTLRNLRVGEARVTVRFWRDSDGRSHFDVLEKHGTLRILRQPPPESLSATLWDRLSGLVPA